MGNEKAPAGKKNVIKPAELFHEFPFHNMRDATTQKFNTNSTSKSLYNYPPLFGKLQMQ
jgi:hypothetical protein